MGGVRPASRMRPVELVDEDDERPASTRHSARDEDLADAVVHGPGHGLPADADLASHDGRRWWPWLLGALAVSIAAGALATGVVERAASERADAFAKLPGVVRPLEAAPTILWRGEASGVSPVMAAGGAIVTVHRTEGPWEVRSRDAVTGAVRWHVPVVETITSGFEAVSVTCVAGADPAALLLCGWTEPNVVYGGEGESTPYVPPTRILALDPADGSELGAWQVDGTALGILRYADDALVATALPDRRVLVERRRGTDGTVVWSWTSAGPLVDSGGLRAAPSLLADGDVLALVAVATTILDARTGEVLEDGPPGRQILLRALPDGGYATWASGLGGHLRDEDGTPRAAVPVLPSPVAGDRSVDELLLDAGNRVLAVSPVDGATSWVLATSMTPVAVVDGVAVLAGGISIGAVDASDGRVLWEQHFAADLPSTPLTDGQHVLTVEPVDTNEYALVARGLRDGVEAWRVALPPDVLRLEAVGGRLVAVTANEILVLG